MDNTFFVLSISMSLKKIKSDIKKIKRIKKNVETGKDRKLLASQKKLIDKYRQSAWCIHVKMSLNGKSIVPKILFIRNGNIACCDCAKKSKYGNLNKSDMVMVPMNYIDRLSDLYYKQHIENIKIGK